MLDRKTAPKYAETNSFLLPSPEINILSNGVPLFLLRGVSQHVLKIELIFNAGKWAESKKGVSHFTAHMLEKGTTTKTSFEIADFFERHGASIEISPGLDFVSLSLYSLTKNITKVLPLFLELITLSVFPEDELTLQKEIFIQNLKISNEKTSYVASKLFRQHLFGDAHPYGRSIEEGDVNQLNIEDLNNFFQHNFSLHQAFVVGSVDDHLLNLLIKELVIIPSAKIENHIYIPVFENKADEYVEKATSTQTSLRLGKRSINRNHKDYPALVLVNHILGGYFGSRLMKNIREDKGLTYGIYSSLNNLKNDSFFTIGADVNRKNKDAAIFEIRNELRLLYEKPINLQEIQTSKNHLLGSLQLEIANPFSVIDKIKTINLYGLNANFYNILFQNIRDLNEVDLQKVAYNCLSDNIIEIAVG